MNELLEDRLSQRTRKHALIKAACHPECGPSYPLSYGRGKAGTPLEGGQVCFSWSHAGLYVFAELEDSNIIAKNLKDEQLHYQHGDVFEVFVKPRKDSYYWEMYATPSGNKSTLFFPSDRDGLDIHDYLHKHDFRGLEVAVEESTAGWNTRMFIPARQLTALGAGWGDGTEWTVFCGRYNYNSEDLTDLELSMTPALSATDYHLTEEYARLKLCDG